MLEAAGEIRRESAMTKELLQFIRDLLSSPPRAAEG